MKRTDDSALRIGAWRVDPALDEISKDGNTVKLERRAMQLLLCLAKHAGQVVSVEQLLDEVWTAVVVTPDSVYHAIAALRRTLGDDAHEPTYIVNVPRRGYRLVALVGPWAEAPNVPVESSQSPAVEPVLARLAVTNTGLPWRRFAIVLSIALLLALSYAVVDKFWLSKSVKAEHPAPAPTMAATDKSIAVLPFVDLSEKKDQEYFADGLAEEVLSLLATLPDLKVISRTSSFQFKGKADDLRHIGEVLGATYILEGSVRRSGKHMRVTAQLIDIRTNAHVWSQVFDRDVTDVLEVQHDIASGIAFALHVEFGWRYADLGPAVHNPEAYDAYLRGMHALFQNDQAGFEEAATQFRHALELQPDFGAAAAGLAFARMSAAEWGFEPPQVGFEDARKVANQLLIREPANAMAHVVLGHIATAYDWDWQTAEREFLAARQAGLKDSAVVIYEAILQMALGRYQDAAQLARAATTLDPLGSLFVVNCWIHLRLGRLAEAENDCRKAIELSPTYVGAHFYLGVVLLTAGRAEEALAEMRKETPIGSGTEGTCIALYALHRRAESDAALAEMIKHPDQNDAMFFAEAYAYRNQKDEAFASLERAYAEKAVELYYIKGDPLLRNLEGDPRYAAFLRKMNLPE